MITRLRPAERAAATVAGMKCGVMGDLLGCLSFVQFNSVFHRYVQDPEHRRTDPPQTSEASTLEKIRGAADSVNDFDGCHRDAIFMNIFHMHRLVADEVVYWVGDCVSFLQQ